MIEQIKYLATGLNETTSYTVNISNAESGKQFNIGEVVLFSAIPPCVSRFSAKGKRCLLTDCFVWQKFFECNINPGE